MTAPARLANGRLIAGQPSLNAGGRPTTAITSLRKEYLPRLDIYLAELERIALADGHPDQLRALTQLLDRLIGRPTTFVETETVHVNWGSAWVEALKAVEESRRAKSIDAEPH
jgi:hypothetical protein